MKDGIKRDLKYVLLCSLLFFILSHPDSYKLCNKLMVTYNKNGATLRGIILHSVIFGSILFLVKRYSIIEYFDTLCQEPNELILDENYEYITDSRREIENLKKAKKRCCEDDKYKRKCQWDIEKEKCGLKDKGSNCLTCRDEVTMKPDTEGKYIDINKITSTRTEMGEYGCKWPYDNRFIPKSNSNWCLKIKDKQKIRDMIM